MTEELNNGKNIRPITENEQISFSFFGGLKIKFQEGGHTITFCISLYTGREEVRIDDQIVSKKRSFRSKTKHHVQFKGNEYVIEFTINSLIKATWTCLLFKNGVLVKEFECMNVQSEQPFYKKHPEAIYGGITGAAFGLGYISFYAVLAALVVGTVWSVWYMLRFLHVHESIIL